MSLTDVQALLERPGELPCVRFMRGDDGRVLTSEDFVRPPAPSRRQWLRRAAAIAATFGLGSLFNIGCDREANGQPYTTGGVRPATMPATAPTTMPSVRGEAFMGDIAPVKGKMHLGEVVAIEPTTAPTTRPATTQPGNDGPYLGRTMGIIAPQRVAPTNPASNVY